MLIPGNVEIRRAAQTIPIVLWKPEENPYAAEDSFVSNVEQTSSKEDSSCSRECTTHVFAETWQMDKRCCLG